MDVRKFAHAGYVRKYDRCPRCDSDRIVYTYVICSNGSVQYRCECDECGWIVPVPHEENINKDRIAQNRRYAWGQAVKIRDGWKCRLCGSTEGVEPHHIVPWDADPGQRFNPENGITLCRLHHDRIHTWRRQHGEEKQEKEDEKES